MIKQRNPGNAKKPIKFKRRQVIIKKSFQLKYAAIVFTAVLATAVTVGGDFYYSLNVFIKEYLGEFPQIKELMESMNQMIYAKIIVLLVIAVAVSLLVSHKFAGPLFKLEKGLINLHKGDLTQKMYIRTGDELKNFSDYFNSIISNFSNWVKNDRSRADEAISKLEDIKNRTDKSDIKKEIEEIQNNLKEIAQNWKISD